MSSPSSSPPPPITNFLTNLGLGYSIAIALGSLLLLLLSTLLLSFYLSCHRNRNHNRNSNNTSNPPHAGIVLARVIFVAEHDDEEEQRGESVAAVGLDQNVINSYPRFQFISRDATATGGGGDEQNTTCWICLSEYKDSEMVRMMPECGHYFHLSCLDSWLMLNGSCPVCRNSPLPTPLSTPLQEVVPLSTPLQEVVPLSQFAADRRLRR